MEHTFPQYYQNPFLSELMVKIIKLVETSKGPAVITDRTLCYPEGGGQPGDRGWIGQVAVLDTLEDAEGSILHYVDGFSTLEVGQEVLMRLDWGHRFEYMQQHTAQHLISGILHTLKAIGTVAVHLGHDCLSIETDRSEIDFETLMAVEDRVNDIVRLNVPVSYQELPLAEARALGLRRAIKVDGLVRLVHIGDFDIIACGGIHVQSTAQIKQVLYKGSEMIRGHVRTHWYAGDRVIEQIRSNQHIVGDLGVLFSAQPHELVARAAELQKSVADALYRLQKTQLQLVEKTLGAWLDRAPRVLDCPVLARDVSTEPDTYVKLMAEAVLNVPQLALCLVQQRTDGNLAWMIVLKGAVEKALPFTVIREQLFPLVQAKGGGKPPLWQGIGVEALGKEAFLTRFVELIDQGAVGVGTH